MVTLSQENGWPTRIFRGASSTQVVLREESPNPYSGDLGNPPSLSKRRASDPEENLLRLGMLLLFFRLSPPCLFSMSSGQGTKSFRRPSSFSSMPLWTIILP